MKKFFEKHDLFKILTILLVIAALATWVFSYTVFQNGELMTFDEKVTGIASIMDQSTIGLFDFNTYIMLVLYYFTNVFAFVFVVFAFYKVLGKSRIYDTIVGKISNLFKGKEIIFAGISLVFYGVFTSITAEPIVALAFIPFSISVFAKLKTDKISSLASTFGGVLLGVLGATYSTKIVGSLINYGGLNIQLGNEMLATIILSIVALIVLMALIYKRMTKGEELEVVEDKFIDLTPLTTKKKVKINKTSLIFTSIALAVFAIVVVLAVTPWTAFNVDTFTKLHESITAATLSSKEGSIFNATYPIIFLGSTTLTAFGEWDLFTVSAFMILMMVIIKFVANIKLDEAIEALTDGLKMSVKPAGLLIMIYAILVFSVSYPVLPGIIAQIDKTLSADFIKPVSYMINGVLTGTFTVDMQYYSSILGGLYSTFAKPNAVALAMQSAYALTGFIAPTSAILVLGLSMLDIKYSDYFKFIWKFLAALFVVILIVLYILILN